VGQVEIVGNDADLGPGLAQRRHQILHALAGMQRQGDDDLLYVFSLDDLHGIVQGTQYRPTGVPVLPLGGVIVQVPDQLQARPGVRL
jgi:hypothetical protein